MRAHCRTSRHIETACTNAASPVWELERYVQRDETGPFEEVVEVREVPAERYMEIPPAGFLWLGKWPRGIMHAALSSSLPAHSIARLPLRDGSDVLVQLKGRVTLPALVRLGVSQLYPGPPRARDEGMALRVGMRARAEALD